MVRLWVAMAMGAAVAAAGCTASPGGHVAQTSTRAPVPRTPSSAPPRRITTATCPTAAPLRLGTEGPVITAAGDGIIAHGLVQSAHVPPQPGVVKIVWRVTGVGSLRVHAVGPGGAIGRLAFGPQLHTGSNFHYPGTEWGTGIRFTQPGCWRIRLSVGHRAVTAVMGIARR